MFYHPSRISLFSRIYISNIYIPAYPTVPDLGDQVQIRLEILELSCSVARSYPPYLQDKMTGRKH